MGEKGEKGVVDLIPFVGERVETPALVCPHRYLWEKEKNHLADSFVLMICVLCFSTLVRSSQVFHCMGWGWGGRKMNGRLFSQLRVRGKRELTVEPMESGGWGRTLDAC